MQSPVPVTLSKARAIWVALLAFALLYGMLSLLQPPTALAQDNPTQVDQPEIVGGTEAVPGAWPWQAALVFSSASSDYYGQYCGGTLIDPNWVLTAAHCADGDIINRVQVVLGKHELSAQDGEHITITEVIIHPEYNGNIGSADLALLRLSQPSTRTVLPLDLAADGNVETRALQAIAIGWGQYEQGYADALRQVALPFFSHARCKQIYTGFTDGASLVSDGMVCAGYENGGKNVCFGDSGGPLMIATSAAPGWKQAGIVSWGPYTCGSAEYPNVYTRVSAYQPWIADCLVDSNGRICTGWDAYEPDNTPAQAHPLLLDSPAQTLTLSSLSDSDWFKFEATAGKIYQFDTVVPDTEIGDTILWLYDTDGITALALGDSYRPNYFTPLGDHDTMRWKAVASGVFYVQVESRWLGRRVDYQISGSSIVAEVFLPVVQRPYEFFAPPLVEVPAAEPIIQILPAVKTPEP